MLLFSCFCCRSGSLHESLVNTWRSMMKLTCRFLLIWFLKHAISWFFRQTKASWNVESYCNDCSHTVVVNLNLSSFSSVPQELSFSNHVAVSSVNMFSFFFSLKKIILCICCLEANFARQLSCRLCYGVTLRYTVVKCAAFRPVWLTDPDPVKQAAVLSSVVWAALL